MNLTDEAIEALYKLCEGDMRKVVNMLQVLLPPITYKNILVVYFHIDGEEQRRAH